MIKKNDMLKTFNGLLLLLLSRFSRVRLCATPQTAARQAQPSLGFSRQEHWSGLPFPSPGDLPDPGIEPGSKGLSRVFSNTTVQKYQFFSAQLSSQSSSHGKHACGLGGPRGAPGRGTRPRAPRTWQVVSTEASWLPCGVAAEGQARHSAASASPSVAGPMTPASVGQWRG